MPLFQSESKCETILMEMTLIFMKMKLHTELIFLNSFEKRGQENSGRANCACVLYAGQQGIESSLLSRFCLNFH